MHIFWKGLKPTPSVFFVWCILLGFVGWFSSKPECRNLLLMLQVWFRWRVTPGSGYKLETWSFQAFTPKFVTACFARSWCKAGWLISSGVEAGGGESDGGLVKTSTAGLILHDFVMLLCWRFANAALQILGRLLWKAESMCICRICHKCGHCRSMLKQSIESVVTLCPVARFQLPTLNQHWLSWDLQLFWLSFIYAMRDG